MNPTKPEFIMLTTTEQQINNAYTAIRASNKTKKAMMAQYVKDVHAIFDKNPGSSRVAFITKIENHLYQLSNIGVKSPNKKKSFIQNKKTQLMTEHFPNLLKELSDLSKVSADTHQDEPTPSNSKVESSQNQKQSSDVSQSQLEKDETFTSDELFKAKDGWVLNIDNTREMLNLFKDWQGTEEEKQFLYQYITENSDLFKKKKTLSPELIKQSIHTFIQENVLRTFLKSEANLYTRLFCVAILAWVLITSTPIQVGILGVTFFLLLFNTLEQYLLVCRFDRALKRIDREYETSILRLVLNWFLTSMLIGAASFLVSTMAAHALPLEIILMSMIGMIMFIPVINHNFSKNRYIHSFDTDIAPLISDKHTKNINQLQKNLKDRTSSSDPTPRNLELMKAELFSPGTPSVTEPSLFGASNQSVATTGSDNINNLNKK